MVDLFCGSGALGLEALSRGASSATFVDADPGALAAVRHNLEAVGLAGEAATLVRARLPGWLAAAPGRSFDLALCDPPYDFDDWADLLAGLQADLAVMESSAAIPLSTGWVVTKERRYGGTLITVVQRTNSDS